LDDNYFAISLTRLKIEVHRLIEICLWDNRHHWSSCPTRQKSTAVIKVAFIKNLNWLVFHFPKYHAEAIAIFQSLPKHERYYYEETLNRYTKFRAWCIDAQHFGSVLSQLRQIETIDLEFVIPASQQGLIVPEMFQALGLSFYQRGQPSGTE
jgi:hypothetical protein